jgi:hypothetical protein
MPGACCTRSLVCKMVRCAHEHTGTAGALRHSLRNGLTAYAALSLETNSSCLHRCRLDGGYRSGWTKFATGSLAPAHGCQDHTAKCPAAFRVSKRIRIKGLATSLALPDETGPGWALVS